jgi:predicted Zn-dependent protease
MMLGRPGDTTCLNTLGVIYYRLGKFDDAVATLQTVVRVVPATAVDWYFLARSHHRLGETAKAEELAA